MLYEKFEIHMEPSQLHILAGLIREKVPNEFGGDNAALLNFACEIEARLQKLALGKALPADDDWLL
jgi:hypothetical protein